MNELGPNRLGPNELDRVAGFSRDEQGCPLFTAPWGRTYRVPDVARVAALRRIVQRSPWLVALLISAVVTPIAIHRRPWVWAFLAAPFVAAIALAPVYRATRGLEVMRLASRADARRRSGATSTASLWAFQALLLVAIFVAAPSLARHGETSLAWTLGATSGAAAVTFAWLLWKRRR